VKQAELTAACGKDPLSHRPATWKRGTIIGTLACMILIQVGCYSGKLDGGKYLYDADYELRSVRQAWIDAGRPDNFNPSHVFDTNYWKVYSFTNSVQAEGKTYRCVFALHDGIWPPGTMAITGDGKELWIRQRDGMVVLDPTQKLIEP